MDRKIPLYAITPHWSTHLGGYVGLAFTLLLSVFAWAFSTGFGMLIAAAALAGFGMLEIVRRAERLAVYDDGVAREYRLLATKRVFAEFESVQDLSVTQSVVERAMGVGTLHINTSGSHGQEIVFKGIANPHDLEHILRDKMQRASIDTPAG